MVRIPLIKLITPTIEPVFSFGPDLFGVSINRHFGICEEHMHASIGYKP